MAESYNVGALAHLAASFESAAGVLADPTTVSLAITQPGGTITTYTYAAAQILKDAVGRYHYDLDLTGAVAGTWEYRWTSTGTPAVVIPGWFTVRADALVELVRDIRRGIRDYPGRTWVANDPLTAGGATLDLPVGDGIRFPQSGTVLEFDDASAERAVTIGIGDTSADTVAIRRAQDGTVAYQHSKDTPVLLAPRWSKAEIMGALDLIVSNELWPQVWVSGEFQLAFQSSAEYYPAPVPDIAEALFAYQLTSGIRYPCHVEFMPTATADDANFPFGALLIRRPMDSGTIYVSYRAVPTLGNLTAGLRSLVVLGTTAHLLMLEEGVHVGPNASAIDKRIGDGAKLRAGATLWQRFQSSRTQLSVALQAHEGTLRSQFARSSH